jgi:hypothetical protein
MVMLTRLGQDDDNRLASFAHRLFKLDVTERLGISSIEYVENYMRRIEYRAKRGKARVNEDGWGIIIRGDRSDCGCGFDGNSRLRPGLLFVLLSS